MITSTSFRLQILLDGGPLLNLTSIAQKHAEDGALLSGLLDREQCLTRNPSVGHSLVVGLALTLTNDHIETVVAQVAGLSRTLYTVTDHGDRFILQYFTCFLQRELLAGDYSLHHATKIHLCHNSFCFLSRLLRQVLYISLAYHASPTREPSSCQSAPTLLQGCDEGVN